MGAASPVIGKSVADSPPMLRRFFLVAAVLLGLLLGVSAPASAQVERDAMTFADVAAIDELHEGHARVLRLYWTFFDRRPDAGGALFWLDQYERCQSIGRIAEHFNASAEFVETYGALDDEDFVELVYRNTLDRPSDAAGASYWLGRLGTDISRAELMVHFSFSNEFVDRRPLPSDGVPIRQCRDLGPVEGGQPRSFTITEWPVFGTVGDIRLRQPSAAVELIGFHQSNHDGAQGIVSADGAAPSFTMDSRNRDTNRRGAADIAAHPLVEVRAPVTGTVVRAGGYTLYCRYSDDYVVIEPDGHPGIEVKILHILGLHVRTGDRVLAGETVLANQPNQLPFRSQIDAFTGDPAWPHVHIEVVDTSIPDRPSPGGGC